MGAWGTEPWDSDDAADWYGAVFKNVDMDRYVESALKYKYDNYNEVRAAAYLLDVLGSGYVWPGDLDKLQGHILRALEILEAMIDRNSTDPQMDFLELWDHNPQVIESVQQQIDRLTKRVKK